MMSGLDTNTLISLLGSRVKSVRVTKTVAPRCPANLKQITNLISPLKSVPERVPVPGEDSVNPFVKTHLKLREGLAARLPSASANVNTNSIRVGNCSEQPDGGRVLSAEITGCEVGKLNVAIACRFALITSVQVVLPVQSPPQPAKLEDGAPGGPGAGVAVRVTCAPPR
jgi:hypothetical protein